MEEPHLRKNDEIILNVPGTEERYGTFVEMLGFDNMCRVHLTSYKDKKKVKSYKEPHWYLAHFEHISKKV